MSPGDTYYDLGKPVRVTGAAERKRHCGVLNLIATRLISSAPAYQASQNQHSKMDVAQVADILTHCGSNGRRYSRFVNFASSRQMARW